ncbi:MAG: aminoacyl-tRNA hydrolase [Candidatus Pacebacteria bacterium]|nr:aminoacyl-tRNA hydrolase [Candidatus Paceibacterota bacterium]
MILIVGLGNPGKKFQKTRHNIGFRVIDEFFIKNRDVHNFSDFKFEKKFQALIAEGKFNNKKIILAKPQTFMNLSGKGAKLLIAFYKLPIDNLWIIHDDIDIPLGKIRIVKSRGAAGHRGIESIIRELKTKDFVRFRIGIQPKSGKPKNIEKFVLQKPSEAKLSEAGDKTKSQRPSNKEEEKIGTEVVKKTVKAVEITFKKGLEVAMNEFNK